MGVRAQNKGAWSDKHRPSWSFVRTKACMVLCNYQSSTTRNELMSAQTTLKTDRSVHCSDTRPTILLFLFCGWGGGQSYERGMGWGSVL